MKTPPGNDPLDPTRWDRTEVTESLDPRRIDQDPSAASGAAPPGAPVLVGSTGPFATLAGRHALDAGGTATDAVLATAFTQIVLSLGSWVSFAGLLGMVQHDGRSGTTATVSAGFAPFRGEHSPTTIPTAPTPSGRTALVPGFVAGARAAHERAGSLPWEQLWSPARWVVERGVPIDDHLVRLLTIRADALTRTAEGRAAFAPEGALPRAGDRLRQPGLASTLEMLAADPGAMYRGAWAERFVDTVRREGGRASLDDLAGYRPLVSAPLVGRFAGHDVATLPAPDLGGAELLAALERLDAERTIVGDPADDPDALVPLLHALGDEHTGSHSDFVVAVDRDGNVASLCHSINTAMWGTSGIVVDGVPVPDPAAFQQQAVAATPAGGHLPMPVEPAIALRDGRPVLACSSIGAGLHPATVLGLHRTLALGRPVAEAVAAPMVHAHDVAIGDSVTSVLTARTDGPISRVVDERLPDGALAAARAAGFAVVGRSADDRALPRGFWGAIGIDPTTGARSAGRTPFGQGPVRTTQTSGGAA